MQLQLLFVAAAMVGLMVAAIRKALLGRFFLPVFMVILLVFTLTKGNPIGLLTSHAGWLILLTMLLVSWVVAAVFDRRVSEDRTR